MSKKTEKTSAYGEIGTRSGGVTAGPILREGIGTRISAVADALGTRRNAAAMAGVSVDALQRYIRGENMPPLDVAARLCRAAAVRLDWLAYEDGPMFSSEAASQAARPEALKMAIQLAAEALEGKYLPPDKYAELVSLIYEGLEEGLPEAKILRFARIASP